MQTLRAKDALCGYGRLIDLARTEPVAEHGRTFVVVLAIEEYERLKAVEAGAGPKAFDGGQIEG